MRRIWFRTWSHLAAAAQIPMPQRHRIRPYGSTLRRRSLATVLITVLMLVVSLGTQDALAFAESATSRHFAEPDVPKQLSGSADGHSGTVSADETRAKGKGVEKPGDAHRPGEGELPEEQNANH